MRTALRTAALALGLILLASPTHPASALEQTGIAAWYGSALQEGGRTASGERLRAEAMTVAHRYLPFGARVRITNLANGRTTTARVNDRGPRYPGRITDVSYRVAKELGFVGKGLARVRLEVLSLR